MAFIRIKKLKKKTSNIYSYAYLVENIWTKEGTRQKPIAYLGKAHYPKKTHNYSFKTFVEKILMHNYNDFLASSSAEEIILSLLRKELFNFGFSFIDTSKMITYKQMQNDLVIVNLANLTITSPYRSLSKSRKIVLKINSDYLCNYTLSSLFNLSVKGTKAEAAKELAKRIIASGIEIQKQTFVLLFEKAYKNKGIKIKKQKKNKPIIAISGTPGTGKTTLAKKIAAKFDFLVIDVTAFIKSKKIMDYYDAKRKTYIVDIKRLNKHLLAYIQKAKKIKKYKGIIVDSHLSHYLPKSKIDLCIITKTSQNGLKELKKRLKKRGYSAIKIKENLEAEAFDICYHEAKEQGHNVVAIDTTEKQPFNIQKNTLFAAISSLI